MYFCVLLLLIIPRLYVRCLHPDPHGPKIIRANIHLKHWNLLEEEQTKNHLDIFTSSLENYEPLIWNVTFLAWPDSIDALATHNISYTILNSYVPHSTIRSEQHTVENRKPLPLCDRPTFHDYVTLEELECYLLDIPCLSTPYKEIDTVSIGKTIENRDILLVKVTHPGANNIMFIDSGIHGRDWLAVMTGLYVLTEVVYAEKNSFISEMNWYIIPVLNPDGYARTHGSIVNRLHLKNMNFKGCPQSCETCGVDLNRNFGYKWGGSGTSSDPCAQNYGGRRNFSELESRALRDVLLEDKENITLYLSIHSYGELFLYPWAYDRLKVWDWRDLLWAGQRAAWSIWWASGNSTWYRVLNTGTEYQTTSGGSDDYARSIGIKYSYIMEVQGGGSTGFDPPPRDIKYYVSVNYAGLSDLVRHINNGYRRYVKPQEKSSQSQINFKLKLFYFITLLHTFLENL